MKQRSMLVAILALSAALCVVGWGVHAQSTSKVTWEYKVVSSYIPPNPPPNIQELNRAGEQGWELVEIRVSEYPTVGSKQFRTDYYLKRAR
jgi:hypothetical protein